jgi:hypothetical protein
MSSKNNKTKTELKQLSAAQVRLKAQSSGINIIDRKGNIKSKSELIKTIK